MLNIIRLNKVVVRFFLLFSSFIFGQVTQDFIPYSLNTNQNLDRVSIILPAVDIESLMVEDDKMSFTKKMRFGYEHQVNHNFFEEANQSLYNDGQIFLMQYHSYDAYAIRAIFEPFYLPDGVRLYVYNNDMTQLEGAYTSENNNDALYFSTPLIEGERIIIELNVEEGVNLDDIQLNISTIIHDYRGIIQMMESNSVNRQCGNDTMCEEAEPYLDQINSAAFLEMGGWLCSGAMLNNMNEDLTPYFLTANHCTDGLNPQGFRFYFNYYREGCNEGEIIQGEYAYSSILRSSCDCIANNSILGPDFSLLQITDNIPLDWGVFYAGFNATDPNQLPVSVGVHHPGGESKRINYDSGYATSDWLNSPSVPDTHWLLTWDSGGTEGGSSGSPIFDDMGRISGVLTGGSAAGCGPTDNTWYGKIATSWEWGDTPQSRLKDWLDPENTGELTMDGLSNYPPEYIIGDVNGDEMINIQDIILVVNFILGNLTPEGNQPITADLNQDLLINIQDILIIINMIVNG